MRKMLVRGALLLGLGVWTTGARADDIYGCTVFLCLQPGVNWQSIAACVGPVTTAINQAGLFGIPFPTCPEAAVSAASSAINSPNNSSSP